MLLAIETSCDETAVTLYASEAAARLDSSKILVELISSQVDLHKPYGGVVPEIAARNHIATLPMLITKAFLQSGTTVKDVSMVAATRGPGLKGCLLVGLGMAKAIAFSRKVPLLALNHLEGHLFACEFMEGHLRPKLPMLALLVSGGHTMLVSVPKFREYKVLASTRDDAAGEAFDKIASILGLPYPGGPALSREATSGNANSFSLPVGLRENNTSFSFSGLKTAVARTVAKLGGLEGVREKGLVADLAASSERAIVEALKVKVAAALKSLRPQSFLLTGGVAANLVLREELAQVCADQDVRFSVPPFKWCTDNATMMAALAASIIKHNPNLYGSEWRAAEHPGYLGPGVAIEVGAVARWPLEEISGV